MEYMLSENDFDIEGLEERESKGIYFDGGYWACHCDDKVRFIGWL